VLVAYGVFRCVAPDPTMNYFEAVQPALDITRFTAIGLIIVGVVVVHMGLIGCYFASKGRTTFLFRVFSLLI